GRAPDGPHRLFQPQATQGLADAELLGAQLGGIADELPGTAAAAVFTQAVVGAGCVKAVGGGRHQAHQFDKAQAPPEAGNLNLRHLPKPQPGDKKYLAAGVLHHGGAIANQVPDRGGKDLVDIRHRTPVSGGYSWSEEQADARGNIVYSRHIEVDGQVLGGNIQILREGQGQAHGGAVVGAVVAVQSAITRLFQLGLPDKGPDLGERRQLRGDGQPAHQGGVVAVGGDRPPGEQVVIGVPQVDVGRLDGKVPADVKARGNGVGGGFVIAVQVDVGLADTAAHIEPGTGGGGDQGKGGNSRGFEIWVHG